MLNANKEIFVKIERLMDNLSAQELMLIAKIAQTRANGMSKTELQVGDQVTFDAKTRGVKTGILIKKNAKTFQVLVGSGFNTSTWKVSPTLLKKVA